MEDRETMYSYLVGQLSGYKVFNFGFHGYGPHQMLSALEHGVVERLVDCEPRAAVYLAILHHAARSAGLPSWDKHGPKYVLSDGTLKFAGHFDDHSPPPRSDTSYLVARTGQELEKSFIHKYFSGRHRPINDRDVKLFLEIVDVSKTTFTSMYPGSAFHVIFWDELPTDKYAIMVEEGLRKKGIHLHLISNILPEFSERRSMYEIPFDKHPNTLAYRYIAQYVDERILGGRQAERVADPYAASLTQRLAP